MNTAKKNQKGSNIMKAAEVVFSKVGFKNAKMDDIANEAGITKVTLYSYFHSKENLYLAVTHKAILLLIDTYNATIERCRDKPGIDSVIALLESFMHFSESNYLYSEMLLEYFALVRASSAGEDRAWLTEAEKQSEYLNKLQEIHNLPFKLTVREIERGKADGSIISTLDPMVSTLMGWSMVLGYTKLLSASGRSESPLFHVSLQQLKGIHLQMARHIFQTKTL